MNNKKRYCSTLKVILQYLKKRNPVSLEGDNKELKKDAFLVPYFLFEWRVTYFHTDKYATHALLKCDET